MAQYKFFMSNADTDNTTWNICQVSVATLTMVQIKKPKED